jgi:hypothetical protein
MMCSAGASARQKRLERYLQGVGSAAAWFLVRRRFFIADRGLGVVGLGIGLVCRLGGWERCSVFMGGTGDGLQCRFARLAQLVGALTTTNGSWQGGVILGVGGVEDSVSRSFLGPG